MLGEQVSKSSSLEIGPAFEERRRSAGMKISLRVDGMTSHGNADNGDEGSVKRPAKPVSQAALQLTELSLAVQHLDRVLDRAIDPLRYRRVHKKRLLASAFMIALALSAAPAKANPVAEPLRFFEGRTEMVSLVKIVMKKPYRSRTVGQGHISPDGTLSLVQQVKEDGKQPRQRRWRIRQVGPGRFSGTMSEAVGPVQVQELGGKFRFTFRMKGSLAIEQWVTPLPGGRSAKSKIIVRKLGMRVASSEGTIRKL